MGEMKPGPEWKRVTISEGGCWLWRGVTTGGYGYMDIRGQRFLAHRVAYTLFVGAIPKGKQLDHLCRVRHCINPAHLEVVTSRENVLRGEGISAQNARKTHCKNGHPFSAENTRNRPDGRRRCRECERTQDQAYGSEYRVRNRGRRAEQQRARRARQGRA